MRIVGFAIVLLLLAAGGWTAFWFYAASEARHGLDDWIARQQAEGLTWTCPGRTVTGFPFALDLACRSPRFSGIVLGAKAEGSLGGLALRVALADPRRAHVDLVPPLAYRTADGETDATLAWSRLSVDLDGLTDGVSAAAIGGIALVLRGRFGGSDPVDSAADKADVSIMRVPDAATAVDVTLAFAGAAVPGLDTFMGDRQPANLDLAARLTQAVFVNTDSTADLVDRWRKAGGLIAFATARLARGQSQVEGSGPLHLDEAHRVAGQLDATFIGLRPILRRYGIDPNIATAGSILTGLFGGKSRKPAADPNAIRLPIVFRGGRLGIGPIMTPIALPPLY